LIGVIRSCRYFAGPPPSTARPPRLRAAGRASDALLWARSGDL